MAVAISMAKSLGETRIAIPTAGNAGAALAAYASRAAIESFVFTPADTPEVTANEIAFHGAHAWRVDGLIGDCAKVVAEGSETMGWLTGPLPRMVAVQSTGCGPIVKAFVAGKRSVEVWDKVTTKIHGVRVPNPLGGALVLDVLYQSKGFGTLVDDDAVDEARARVCAEKGLHLCPEGAACLVALEMERSRGRVGPHDRVVVFNTASGLKSPMPQTLNKDELDYSKL